MSHMRRVPVLSFVKDLTLKRKGTQSVLLSWRYCGPPSLEKEVGVATQRLVNLLDIITLWPYSSATLNKETLIQRMFSSFTYVSPLVATVIRTQYRLVK